MKTALSAIPGQQTSKAEQLQRFQTKGSNPSRPVQDSEEDKENQGAEGGLILQPRQRCALLNFNYRHRCLQTGDKPGQQIKEAKTGGDPSEKRENVHSKGPAGLG